MKNRRKQELQEYFDERQRLIAVAVQDYTAKVAGLEEQLAASQGTYFKQKGIEADLSEHRGTLRWLQGRLAEARQTLAWLDGGEARATLFDEPLLENPRDGTQ